MRDTYRRYEILLPLKFNDGQPVPPELIGETAIELRARFGAVSTETQTIQGRWQHQGAFYQDELARVFVDVPDLPEHEEFFVAYKETLKIRFRRLDIWLTSHPIKIL